MNIKWLLQTHESAEGDQWRVTEENTTIDLIHNQTRTRTKTEQPKKNNNNKRKNTTSSYRLGWLEENANYQNTLKSPLASFWSESFFHQSGSGQTNQHPLRRKAKLQPCTCHLTSQLIDIEPRSSFRPYWMTGYPSLTAFWQKLKVCWWSPESEGAVCDITEVIFSRMWRC